MTPKITQKVVSYEDHVYTLSDDLDLEYHVIMVDGKETSRKLEYVGKNLYKYPLSPMYVECTLDWTYLKTRNPFYGEGFKWFRSIQAKVLPDPEAIELNKIIYIQSARYALFDINKRPVPCAMLGDYARSQIDNKHYDLARLLLFLRKNPHVIQCSDIEEIPCYNRDEDRTHCLDVWVYPDASWLEWGYQNVREPMDAVFTPYWDKDHPDFLGLQPFVIARDE